MRSLFLSGADASSARTPFSKPSPTPRTSDYKSCERTSTPSPIRTRPLVANETHPVRRGLLDTSVVIDLKHLSREVLPDEVAISAVTLAELAAGPQATRVPDVRARRQEVLQRVEAVFDVLPLDVSAARAYARIVGAEFAAGRKARGARAMDLLIAATALSRGLTLYTRNPSDFDGVRNLVDVHVV